MKSDSMIGLSRIFDLLQAHRQHNTDCTGKNHQFSYANSALATLDVYSRSN